MVLRGTRIVTLIVHKGKAVDIAHQGPLGIVETQDLIWGRVWLPVLDKIVENTTKSSTAYQATIKEGKQEPVEIRDLPDGPLEVLAVKFNRPIWEDCECILIWMDEFSRYPEIEIIPSTCENYVPPKYKKIFSTQRKPVTMKSDIEPPFNRLKVKALNG